MALIYYMGGTPIFEEEAKQKQYSGDFHVFNKALSEGSNYDLKVRHGVLSTKDFDKPEFKKIGIGKPLSIEILTIYSGDAPNRFLGKKDLLVTSGVKSIITYEEAPKAVNQIFKKINDNTYYEPSASNIGCPLVYYTPALDMGTILCSFSLVADTFNEETFDKISSLLTKAGGIPVFAPTSTILLAGSIISGMISKLGKALFESKPFFKGDIDIRLDTPDHPITKSDHIAIIDSRHEDEFENYTPKSIKVGGNTQIRLVNIITNKFYDGNAPYILVSIDGREKDEFKSFNPTIASASILEKFYGTDFQGQTIEVIQEAMGLYNDLEYRKKATSLEKKLETITDKSSEEYTKMKALLDAYQKNIENDLLKLT
ncbi:hypothetical protein ACJD0Z_03375 [Flavobacteriaceae bacterium M23B6Z8]